MANTFITTKEAARMMGVTVGYLHTLMSKNKISYTKSAGGKLCYFEPAVIEGWMTAKKVSANNENGES